MILRDLLSTVLGEAGFLVPTSFVGSPAPDDAQMVYLANRASAFLLEKRFQRLRQRATITLTTATEYDLPNDFLEMIPDTARVNARLETLDLPASAVEWAYLKASAGPSNYLVRARLLGGKFAIHSPQPGAIVSFEYSSKYPILGNDGVTYKQRFTNDADSWLLDDDLLILEIKWRFEKAKGLPDWQASLTEAVQYRNSVMGREASSQTILGTPPAVLTDPYTRTWIDG